MAIYIDSAVLTEIEHALRLGFVDGVTTNPTLVARARATNAGRVKDNYHLLKTILAMIPGKLFAQVTAEETRGIVHEGERLAGLDVNRVVVKIPCLPAGIAALRALRAEGIQTLLTAVFSPLQAYIAAGIGASYIAPYVGRFVGSVSDDIARLERDASPEADFIRSLREMLGSAPDRPRILAASLKSREAVIASIQGGADDVTLPLSLLDEIWRHPLTDQAVTSFATDAGFGRCIPEAGE